MVAQIKRIRNIALYVIAVFLLCVFCFSEFITAKAEETTSLKFDRTYVLDDLESCENFDILRYPINPLADPKVQVIEIVEYCYSYDASKRDKYGLYLYVYNPTLLDIDATSGQNKVQIAVRYNTHTITNNSRPTLYEKFDIKFCSKVENGAYKGLFYKFKVIDHKSDDGKTIAERVNSNSRRYDISGIELLTVGNSNSTEYPLSKTYSFSGYSKGMGADEELDQVTLESKVLETVSLDVKNTYYRTGHSNKGKNHQNQLDSVYFAVDNALLDKYGKLQEIRAEWFEYKTQPIIVTDVEEFYSKANNYIGQSVNPFNQSESCAAEYGLVSCSTFSNSNPIAEKFIDWGWNFNNRMGYGSAYNDLYSDKVSRTLYYLFYNSDISYDPLADKIKNGGIESNRLYEYIRNYDKSFSSGRLPVKDGNISADLFLTTVDENRTRGYNVHDINAADIEITKMLSYNSTQPSFWKKSEDFGFWKALFNNLPDNLDETIVDLPPIAAVKDSDIANGDNFATSKNLYINSADVPNFVEYYNDAKSNDKTTFLFRFAVTDYYANPAYVFKLNTSKPINAYSQTWENGAYYAQETVFFDFDIIQLTFGDNGALTAIPVVSSPIDIFDDVTVPLEPDDNGFDWDKLWKILVFAIAVIVAIVCAIVFFPHIITFVIWLIKTTGKLLFALLKGLWLIISAPFRGIAALVRKRKDKK